MIVTFTSNARPPKRTGVVVASTAQQSIMRAGPGGRCNPNNRDVQARRRIFGEGARAWSLLDPTEQDDWTAAAAAADVLNVKQRPFAGNGPGLFGRIDRAFIRMTATPRPTTAESAGQRNAAASITGCTLIGPDTYEVTIALNQSVTSGHLLITASAPANDSQAGGPKLWRNVWQIPIAGPFGPGSFNAQIDSGWPAASGQRVWFVIQFVDLATNEDGRVKTGPFTL